MDIVCSTDDRFVQHCGVMLTSLFENNTDEYIAIHLLHVNLSKQSQKSLSNIVAKYRNSVLVFYQIENNNIFNNLPTSKNISISAYLRLFITNILSENIKKIIYLDCDIIINNSIKEFYNIDLSNLALVAVEDCINKRKEIYTRLNYPISYSYFNTGVLLMNLEYLRSNNYEKHIITFLSNHYKKIKLYDQDVLNSLFYDKKLLISKKWNYIEYNSSYNYTGEPNIIHFAGIVKPWHYGCRNKYTSLYYKYLSKTEWSKFKPNIHVFMKEIKFPDNLLYIIHLQEIYNQMKFYIINLIKR